MTRLKKITILYDLIGDNVKDLKQRLGDIAFHLQSLNKSDIFPKIQKAVEHKDKVSLIKTCEEAKIPSVYLSTIVSVLLSATPQQKWPEVF